MALKKNIISKNGVSIGYFKISNITFNNGVLQVTVDGYTNETYRQNEKDNDIKKQKHEQLIQKSIELSQDENADIEETKKISEEANSLVGTYEDDLCLSIIQISCEFKDVTDFSIDNIYSLLKNTIIESKYLIIDFKDAEDLL